jgi:hypothetical protein
MTTEPTPSLPQYPRDPGFDIEQAVTGKCVEAWEILAPYRPEGRMVGLSDFAGHLLIFLHSVQPSVAYEATQAIGYLMEGAKDAASNCAPDESEDWQNWGQA